MRKQYYSMDYAKSINDFMALVQPDEYEPYDTTDSIQVEGIYTIEYFGSPADFEALKELLK